MVRSHVEVSGPAPGIAPLPWSELLTDLREINAIPSPTHSFTGLLFASFVPPQSKFYSTQPFPPNRHTGMTSYVCVLLLLGPTKILYL